MKNRSIFNRCVIVMKVFGYTVLIEIKSYVNFYFQYLFFLHFKPIIVNTSAEKSCIQYGTSVDSVLNEKWNSKCRYTNIPMHNTEISKAVQMV